MTWKEIIPGVYQGEPDRNDNSDIASSIRISKIPPSTRQTHRLSTFEVHNGVKSGFDIANEFLQGKDKLPFLTLLGTPGTGKTHLALALGWDFLEQGKTVLYYHVIGLLNELRDGYKRSGENDFYHIISFARNCSLLILDDLGAEKETEWATEQLDYIIDSRYEDCKPLIVTTNLARDQLPPRIMDRLTEGTLVQLRGESHRRKGGKAK